VCYENNKDKRAAKASAVTGVYGIATTRIALYLRNGISMYETTEQDRLEERERSPRRWWWWGWLAGVSLGACNNHNN
jgi:hypothetical protein